MKTSRQISTRIVTAAIAISTVALIAAPANALTIRDHRGEPATPQVQQSLPCVPFKYCAKSGVIVRDHRTGAIPGGK